MKTNCIKSRKSAASRSNRRNIREFRRSLEEGGRLARNVRDNPARFSKDNYAFLQALKRMMESGIPRETILRKMKKKWNITSLNYSFFIQGKLCAFEDYLGER